MDSKHYRLMRLQYDDDELYFKHFEAHLLAHLVLMIWLDIEVFVFLNQLDFRIQIHLSASKILIWIILFGYLLYFCVEGVEVLVFFNFCSDTCVSLNINCRIITTLCGHRKLLSHIHIEVLLNFCRWYSATLCVDIENCSFGEPNFLTPVIMEWSSLEVYDLSTLCSCIKKFSRKAKIRITSDSCRTSRFIYPKWLALHQLTDDCHTNRSEHFTAIAKKSLLCRLENHYQW